MALFGGPSPSQAGSRPALSLGIKTGLCLMLILCAVLYGKTHFYRDPGSVFFDKSRAYEQGYSKIRKEQIQKYVGSVKNGEAAIGKAGTNPSMCLAMSSVKRQRVQYLETSVGSILQGLAPQERSDLHLAVLIAQSDPTSHPDWSHQWIHQAVDDIFSYSNTTEEDHIRDLEKENNFAEKGVHDYSTALKRCYDAGAPYVALFEDDLMMADGWLVRTLLGLRQIPATMGVDGLPQWLYIRLFNQERSIGWASKEIGGNGEYWIIFGIAVGIYAAAALARRRWRSARTHLDVGTICILALILNPALVILFYQSGKASLLPPAPGVFEEPFGCCSQAMIFPREQVPAVINFLKEKGKGQIDLLLNDMAEEKNLKRYALYPVQAQHIGLDSARKTQLEEAQAIWSMAYEDLDERMLKNTHQRMVAEYYGANK